MIRWAMLLVLVIAIMAVLIWMMRRVANPRSHEARAREVADFVGPRRLREASTLLRQAARRGEAWIAPVWEVLELPLVEAIPDCPPPTRLELVAVLEACHERCRNRELQKRLMTFRNSLG